MIDIEWEMKRLRAERDEAERRLRLAAEAGNWLVRSEPLDVLIARLVAERDTLAAALAEVREAARVVTAHARYSEVTYASCVELDRALAALPADLAADAFRRARAEALEAAADAIEDPATVHPLAAYRAWAGWLRARAADERGGR